MSRQPYRKSILEQKRPPEPATISRGVMIGRSLLAWLAIILVEMLHGVARALTLTPLVGEFRANQLGVLIGSVLILGISLLTIRWIDTRRRADLWLVGAIWVLLTVSFELLFGLLVVRRSWERLAADYDLPAGGLMPLGLALMLVAPQIAVRLRGKPS